MSSRARAEVSPVPPSATPVLGPNGLPLPVPPTTRPATSAPVLPRPRPIDADTKKAASLTPQQTVQIDSYIKSSFSRLMSDDATTVEQGRADLIIGVADPAPKQPSSAPYLSQYMSTLEKELQPIVGKGSLARRLNAAIVIARICESINTSGNAVPLQPLHGYIIAELKDKCDAVALWGMKAATQALAAAPGVPGTAMRNEIVPCVTSHGLNGALTEEAYGALDYATPEGITTTIKLYQARVAEYAKGLPSEPSVDRRGASHLTSLSGMWGKMTKAQQAQVMDLIRQNLAGGAAAIVQPSATPETVAQLRTLLQANSGAVYVATQNDPALSELNLNALRVTKLSESIPAQELAAAVQLVVSGLQQAYPGGNTAGANAAVAKP